MLTPPKIRSTESKPERLQNIPDFQMHYILKPFTGYGKKPLLGIPGITVILPILRKHQVEDKIRKIKRTFICPLAF
jgi:hypothetical protein